jgi:KipI family sensor histidine kinase inhibitor
VNTRRVNARRIALAGDSALVVEFEEGLDPAVNRRVVRLGDCVRMARWAGIREVVPAFHSITIYFDPLGTDVAELTRWLTDQASASVEASIEGGERIVRVPVRYGGEDGPDLQDVAAFAGMLPDEVAALHSAREYRVFMLGFVPGFAYLAPVDDRIAMPRLDTPRTRVPAGSVGVAGLQTGIYPGDTPGGWRLIGRTDLRPFDLSRDDPFLLKPGDRVQFHAEVRR